MIHRVATLFSLSLLLLSSGCAADRVPEAKTANSAADLMGAWRSKIHFTTGPFEGVQDLEFLYAYNAGGTMTESSNYDEAANSSPPAYGAWREIGPHQFETKYLFFTTRAPERADGPGATGGWLPTGYGVLTETITLADDGKSYTSTVSLAAFDKFDAPIAGSGTGTGFATRIGW